MEKQNRQSICKQVNKGINDYGRRTGACYSDRVEDTEVG